MKLLYYVTYLQREQASTVECGQYIREEALLHRLGSEISSWLGHELEAKSQPHFTWPPSPTAMMATVAGTNCYCGAVYCFLFVFSFFFFNVITTTLCKALLLTKVVKIQSHPRLFFINDMNKSVLSNHFTKPVLNAMKHLMFGCYAVSQCSVSCIISYNIFGHLRFAAVFEGLRQCYKNVLTSHLPFSSVS